MIDFETPCYKKQTNKEINKAFTKVLLRLVQPSSLKIPSPAEKPNRSSCGSAGGAAAAAETTRSTTESSSREPTRQNRRNRRRRNRNRQKKPASNKEDDVHVFDNRVAVMEKDNNNNGNGNLAESEHKKTEAAAAAATLTAETASTTTSRDEAKRAREWFATLSTEDQVVALGFAADQDFLATLSRSAATFLSFPSVSGRENPTMDGLYSKGQYSFYAGLEP